MYEDILAWLSSLTMEQTFILTGLSILFAGVGVGLLIGWIFEIENKEDEDDGGT